MRVGGYCCTEFRRGFFWGFFSVRLASEDGCGRGVSHFGWVGVVGWTRENFGESSTCDGGVNNHFVVVMLFSECVRACVFLVCGFWVVA